MRPILIFIVGAILATPSYAEEIQFLNALTNKPLKFKYRKDQAITPAVTHFHKSGENVYSNDNDAIAKGRKIYMKLCQSCHLKDGKGRIGPDLTDDQWRRKRTHTEVGRFEIIYGGGPGAMKAFGKKLDQDDILKVMAFTNTFRAAK